MKDFEMTRIQTLVTKVFLFCFALLITAASAQAVSLSGPVALTFDGQCGKDGSRTVFSAYLYANGGEFDDQDYLVDFGGGYTEWRDSHVFYVVDSANKIIGRYHEGFAHVGFAGQFFFEIGMLPTASGNVTIYLVDEADQTPDQAMGAVFSGASRASYSFARQALTPIA